MSHRALLILYLAWIENKKGTSFSEHPFYDDEVAEYFSREQWNELKRLNGEAISIGKIIRGMIKEKP